MGGHHIITVTKHELQIKHEASLKESLQTDDPHMLMSMQACDSFNCLVFHTGVKTVIT